MYFIMLKAQNRGIVMVNFYNDFIAAANATILDVVRKLQIEFLLISY